MQWVAKTPQYGDVIRTKVQFYYHYGIFVSEEEVIQFGLPNDPLRSAAEIKVLSGHITEFMQGGEVEVAEPKGADRRRMRSPDRIVAQARSCIGEGGYHILHNNCEHFVNRCAFGENSASFMQDVRQMLRKKLGK